MSVLRQWSQGEVTADENDGTTVRSSDSLSRLSCELSFRGDSVEMSLPLCAFLSALEGMNRAFLCLRVFTDTTNLTLAFPPASSTKRDGAKSSGLVEEGCSGG